MKIQNRPGTCKALIVDDHHISGRYVSALLESLGLAVRCVRTAGQAVTTALAWRPDLICMDYHLPDLDGLAASGKIRSQWPGTQIQPTILLMSGEVPGVIRSGPDAAAVDRVLIKPVRRLELKKAALECMGFQAVEPLAEPELPYLRELFREELQQRLQELDRELLQGDHAAVSAILHQLIASSAMCREERLESSLRKLDRSCRRGDPPAEMAQAYYHVIGSAREFLGRESPPAG